MRQYNEQIVFHPQFIWKDIFAKKETIQKFSFLFYAAINYEILETLSYDGTHHSWFN